MFGINLAKYLAKRCGIVPSEYPERSAGRDVTPYHGCDGANIDDQHKSKSTTCTSSCLTVYNGQWERGGRIQNGVEVVDRVEDAYHEAESGKEPDEDLIEDGFREINAWVWHFFSNMRDEVGVSNALTEISFSDATIAC